MRIVIVGDREDEAVALQALCEAAGHDTRFSADVAGCLDVDPDESPDLVFLSASAFEGRVVALVASMRRCLESTAVVLITDDAAVRETVSAIRAGATVVRRPLESESVRRTLREVESRMLASRRRPDVPTLLAAGREPAPEPEVQQLLDLVISGAGTSAPVLVAGGSGVGSQLVVNLLHAYSPRASGPLVKVSCANVNVALIETGALFDVVRGGTLWLDEVGDLSPRWQGRLLRALDGRLRPLAESRAIDVRVIATTSINLLAAVRAGAFREDLYFRLNTINVTVPACLDRPDDALAVGLHLPAVPTERRADKSATPSGPSLRIAVTGSRTRRAPDAQHTLASLEHRALRDALSRTGGDTQAAADMLGIQRRTLYRKLRKHHLGGPSLVQRTGTWR